MDSCLRCSRCCQLKEYIGGGLSKLTPDDCPFLERYKDGKTLCSVYESRFNCDDLGVRNICVPIEQAISFGDLPPDCPYALKIEGYRTKVIDWML